MGSPSNDPHKFFHALPHHTFRPSIQNGYRVRRVANPSISVANLAPTSIRFCAEFSFSQPFAIIPLIRISTRS